MGELEKPISEEILSCDLTPRKVCEESKTGNCFPCNYARNFIYGKVYKNFSGGTHYVLEGTENYGLKASVNYLSVSGQRLFTLSVIEGHFSEEIIDTHKE